MELLFRGAYVLRANFPKWSFMSCTDFDCDDQFQEKTCPREAMCWPGLFKSLSLDINICPCLHFVRNFQKSTKSEYKYLRVAIGGL